jgi:hypothetical protein
MIKAWHFVGPTLRNGDPVPADGEVLRRSGPVEICKSGLHASRRLIDALNYAPGSTICRVGCRDVEEEEVDKLVCRERTILWRVDGDALLRDFARRCALDVAHLWDAPDVVLRYLRTGDDALRHAALEASRAAAGAAAGDAAGAAARAAARAAQNRRLTAMVSAAHRKEAA